MSYCAYCLKECATSVKMCNHFKNGAHFYKECQTLDCWSPNGTGQWHFNWCAKCEYVEEDSLNLNRVPIPNKDLGLQNKNVNRAGFKILTESVYTELDSHSGIFPLKYMKFCYKGQFIIYNTLNFVRNP